MSKVLTVGLVVYVLSIAVVTFNSSLPNWCANPSGSGNWIVQPLCK